MTRRTPMFLIAIACAAACTTGDADDGGGTCEPERITAPTAAACAASTKSCLDACQDETCADGCFAAEPNADACFTCLDDAFLSCANAAGCAAAWDTLDCCVQDCDDPESDACYTATCAAEIGAYDACLSTKDGCFTSDAVCFP